MIDTLHEIRFGGSVPTTQTPKVAPFRKKDGTRNAFDIIEQAFFQLTSTEEGKAQYGDPEKGATLEQAWRTAASFTGQPPVCLLATGKPAVPVDAIERVIRLNLQQLVNAARDILQLSDRSAIQTFYHDGNLGHCVTLTKYDKDTGRFHLIDPWPDFSLLSKDYNAAGIDAQRVEGQVWSITEEELKRVIFACFVFKNFWAEYTGETYFSYFPDILHTDFWKFFHIKITDVVHEDGMTLVRLKPGGSFASEIDLYTIHNSNERIVEAVLSLKRTWILGPPYGINPFALDIVRSFIGTLPAPPDIPKTSDIVKLFKRISDKTYVTKLIADQNYLGDIAKVYLGLATDYTVPFDYSHLTVKNQKVNDLEIISFELKIDAL